MKFFRLALLVSLVLAACGKNDPFVPTNQMPPQNPGNFAPPPGPGGNQLPPGFQQIPFQPQNPGQQFNPSLPQGQPQQFSPFVPVYQWMQGSPQGQAYWTNLWNGWQHYSYQRGQSPYNFQGFWNEYCGNSMGLQNQPWYGYFDSQFYGWMNQSPSYQSYQTVNVDPQYYWYYYQGTSFNPLNSYYQQYYGNVWF